MGEEKKCYFVCKSIPPLSKSSLHYGQAKQKGLSPDSIKVMVWNLYKGEKKDFARDFPQFASGKDLLILQEVVMDDVMPLILFKIEDLDWDMAISFYLKNQVSTGVVTASKSLSLEATLTRTVDREPIILSPKMNLINKYSLMNRDEDLMVINIHGINFRNTSTLKRQLEQVETRITDHDGPIIFAGDFNTRNKSRMKMTLNFMQKHGFESVEFANDSRRKKLDHIFFRDMIINESQIFIDLKSSDHPMLYVDLKHIPQTK